MSNTSNMGMGNMGTGNMGSGNMGGNGGSAVAAFFADRVYMPFVTEIPPDDGQYKEPPVARKSFPTRNWAPEYYSWLVLTQFMRTKWDTFDERNLKGTPEHWGPKLLPMWASDDNGKARWNKDEARKAIGEELTNLFLAARDERSDALGEIVAQRDEFASYFLNMLSASSGYPATAKLLTIASFIAGFCAMYYKGKYQRPRPTMLLPSLLPPIPVPGHSSFPNGHSTQAHLMAACLKEVLHPANPKDQDFVQMERALDALADRIARNREVGGLHYPSDSTAGKLLAPLILEGLKQTPEDLVGLVRCPIEQARLREDLEDSGMKRKGNKNESVTWFQRALDDARSEWHPELP